ncbi:MAG: tRNA threonylcarbamoyladenosine biosynthesis protein TsaB [Dokdonia sp.]|jgi:tRNA threonylcarbamoyladenosine biosynthesis protein TsaB
MHRDSHHKLFGGFVYFNGEYVVLKEDNGVQYSHSERLHPYIEEVLAIAKMNKEVLTAIAISKGSGSYIGLHIEVSAAKGL